jgi:hypothetical protein
VLAKTTNARVRQRRRNTHKKEHAHQEGQATSSASSVSLWAQLHPRVRRRVKRAVVLRQHNKIHVHVRGARIIGHDRTLSGRRAWVGCGGRHAG